MSSTYKPKPGSIPERVCQFFLANPDEELTRGDYALKFDTLASSADNTLKACVDAGLLVRESSDSGMVWKRGAALTEQSLEAGVPPPNGFKGWLAKKGAKSAEGRTKATDLPAPSALVLTLTKNVPLPTPKQRADDYHPVWQAMEVNDSISVSPAVAKRLVGFAQAWAKPRGFKFITRVLDETTARIWRLQ